MCGYQTHYIEQSASSSDNLGGPVCGLMAAMVNLPDFNGNQVAGKLG